MTEGLQIGSYVIERQLGRGGFGIVYVGVDTRLGRRAAIKQLLPELTGRREIVERFFNEARAAATINHPGIVEIYEVGWHTDGTAYFAMKLLEGDSLAKRMRDTMLSIPHSATIARQVAGALAAAHARGIVHRDLKPDNIVLVPDDEVAIGERATVLDFGIAKLVNDQPLSMRTATGMMMGTPFYMSPEQCRGAGEVDHRTDVYALGCILYEMLAGHPPFEGAGAGEVLGKHQFVDTPTLGSQGVDVPAELEALVMRMLAKTPEERPQQMTEVVAALQPFTGTRATAEASAPMPRTTGPATPSMSRGTATAGTSPTATPMPRAGAAAGISPTATPMPRADAGAGRSPAVPGGDMRAMPDATSTGRGDARSTASPTAVDGMRSPNPTAADDLRATPNPTAAEGLRSTSRPTAPDSAATRASHQPLTTLGSTSAEAIAPPSSKRTRAPVFVIGGVAVVAAAVIAFVAVSSSSKKSAAPSDATQVALFDAAVADVPVVPVVVDARDVPADAMTADTPADAAAAGVDAAVAHDGKPKPKPPKPPRPPNPPPPEPPKCDDASNAAAEQAGTDAFASGQYAAALAKYEVFLQCKPNAKRVIAKAVAAACRLKNATKAKQYFARSGPRQQQMLVQSCLREGIDLRGAPDGAAE